MKLSMIYASIGALLGTLGVIILPATVFVGLLLIIGGIYLFLVGGPISYFRG